MNDQTAVEPIGNGICILVPMLMFVAMCGCGSNEEGSGPGNTSGLLSVTGSGPFYSGNFAVTNENDRTIRIDKVNSWENFGGAQPSRGVIIPGNLVKESHFSNLDRFPDSTVVSWVYDGDDVAHSQAINLKGVVPANTEGYTEFIFDAAGAWTVRFVAQ